MKQGASKGTIRIDPKRCKGCGLCISTCPAGSVSLADEVDHRGIRVACFDDGPNCSGCAFCAIICPDVAIEVYKKRPPKS